MFCDTLTAPWGPINETQEPLLPITQGKLGPALLWLSEFSLLQPGAECCTEDRPKAGCGPRGGHSIWEVTFQTLF